MRMLAKVLRSRGKQKNRASLSSSDPESQDAGALRPPGKVRQARGLPHALMRQAIEEGFITCVRNYTTYSTFYRLVKAVEDDPNVPKKKATKSLAKFMSLHPLTLPRRRRRSRALWQHIAHQLGGEAKAMV